MTDILNDLKIAVRALVRRPGFTTVAVLTIALAMGGVTAIFTLLKGALLEPLPYEEADRLVTLDVVSRQGFYISTSIPNYHSWAESGEFDRFGASAGFGMTLTGDGPAEIINTQAVLGDLFGVLGARAYRGRLLGPAETELGSAPAVVLGHQFWTDRFGADERVIGESLTLDGRPHTVVGVLEPGWSFPNLGVQMYLAMGSYPDLPWTNRESSFGTRIYARLADGASIATALDDLARINLAVTEEVGLENASVEIRSLSEMVLGDLEPALWILFGAVGFVLLIATANVANLTLARGEGRKQEVAVRTALGAGRWTVVRGLLLESIVLSLAGGAVGLAVAFVALKALTPLLPMTVATSDSRVGLDVGVLLFTFVAAASSGLLFGLVPALRASRPDLSDDLKEGSRTSTGGNRRLRGALVVAEVALSMVLLVGSGLMIRTLYELRTVDKGFEAEGLLTARIALSEQRYDTRETWAGFYEQLEERMRGVPGVEHAATTLLLPLANRSWERRIFPEGAVIEPDNGDSVLYGIVSASYFETMGIPIVQGRAFTAADRQVDADPDAGPGDVLPPGDLVAIIDETMAERYWPGESPLGKRVTFEFGGTPDDPRPVYRTVVGVAENVRHYELETPSRIQVYIPLLQSGTTVGADLSIVLKTSIPPEDLVAPLRREAAAMDPDAPLSQVSTLQEYVDNAMRAGTAMGGILTTFSALAMLLAGIGIFGVLSYTVVQRTSEIGIRMALGADGPAVRRWVAREGLVLAGLGVGIGLVAALALTRLLQSFLFGVEAVDPVIYGGLAAFLLAITFAATYLPAMSATRVDPASVLRGSQ
ncbi:MAG: ABC transporter permease [Gemmatimonadota bacterium]|nr:ABC transporter permease [Gemmatimonadota bacterium]